VSDVQYTSIKGTKHILNKNMKLVIDGNIASGKTTQLNLLQNNNFNVKREPIEKWPLSLYYSDPEKWGLFFQIIVLKSHSKTESGSCVYERFPGSGTDVFWPIMKKTQCEDKVYQEVFKRYGWTPDVYIWIHTTPENCFENLKNRQQSGDNSVTKDYLVSLDKQYKCMFDKLDCLKFEINGDQSKEKVHDEILKIINKYY